MNLLATYISGSFGVIAQAISGSSLRAGGKGTSSALLDASKRLVGSVFEALRSVPEGLTEPEVQERLGTYGRNTVAQRRAAVPVLLLTSLIMGVGLYLPYSTLGSSVSLVHLPRAVFPWLVVTLLAYGGLTQLVKTRYIQRFHTWL